MAARDYTAAMPSTVTIPHIRMDEQGRPWLDDTNFKVIEILIDL